ncbi:hypothetical protein TRVA0_012S00892 [Trichomonascus vanleenenianus]|uniref:oxygen-dependent protoporphyrinogen oxidase n=1 Tax=Trichomonascus vanleenenianus TaxID=2268995 RepID=UPI003ECA093E
MYRYIGGAAVPHRGLHSSSFALAKKPLRERFSWGAFKNEKVKPEEEFSPKVELGIRDLREERFLANEQKDNAVWREVLSLQRPDSYSLLPLTRSLEKSKRMLARKKKPTSKPTEAKDPITELKETFQLIGDLIRGRKKISFAQKVDEDLPPTDPIEHALWVKRWDQMTSELETTITRIHNVGKGQELIILGGGISGLSLAWYTAKARPDIRIRIVEGSNRVGGYMQSESVEVDGGKTMFEFGPRTLLPSHPGTLLAIHMMEELGLLDKLGGIPKNAPVNTKGLVYGGDLVKLPNHESGSFVNFMRSPIMKGVKLAPLKDFFVARARDKKVNDESVESFISRRFNGDLAKRFVSALMRGIYGGDSAELSARSVTRLNRAYLVERTEGASVVGSVVTGILSSIDEYTNRALPLLSQTFTGKSYANYQRNLKRYSMVAIQGGIEQLADAIANDLRQMNHVNLDLGQKVHKLKPIEKGCEVVTDSGKIYSGSVVVSTLPGREVGPALTAAPKAQQLISQIKFTNMAVVDFFFPSKKVGLNWFGILVPKTESGPSPNGDVLGVIFDSAVRNSVEPVADKLNARDITKEYASVQEMEQLRKEAREKFNFSNIAASSKEFLADQLSDSAPVKRGAAELPDSTTLTVMMGGHLWDGKASLPSEGELELQAITFLNHYLGTELHPEDYHVKIKYQTQSIPQYTVGHSDRVQEIHEDVSKAYSNRVFLSGTTFGRGVGVGDCFVDSITLATRFSPQRKLLFPRYYINHYMAATYPKLYA